MKKAYLSDLNLDSNRNNSALLLANDGGDLSLVKRLVKKSSLKRN